MSLSKLLTAGRKHSRNALVWITLTIMGAIIGVYISDYMSTPQLEVELEYYNPNNTEIAIKIQNTGKPTLNNLSLEFSFCPDHDSRIVDENYPKFDSLNLEGICEVEEIEGTVVYKSTCPFLKSNEEFVYAFYQESPHVPLQTNFYIEVKSPEVYQIIQYEFNHSARENIERALERFEAKKMSKTEFGQLINSFRTSTNKRDEMSAWCG